MNYDQTAARFWGSLEAAEADQQMRQYLLAERQMRTYLTSISEQYPEARVLQDEIICNPTGADLALPKLSDVLKEMQA